MLNCTWQNVLVSPSLTSPEQQQGSRIQNNIHDICQNTRVQNSVHNLQKNVPLEESLILLCYENMTQFFFGQNHPRDLVRGEIRKMKFGVPRISQEPKDHLSNYTKNVFGGAEIVY